MKTKVIGITGGIGSGKSTVAKIIEKAGYPVYYSDERAKEIVHENLVLKEKIIQLLGEESYRNEQYNRKYVAKKVFQNPILLKSLNALIHPAIAEDFQYWLEKYHAPLAFKESALLFELNLHKSLYKTLLVTTDDDIRIERVMRRDGKTRQEVEAIIRQQLPESEKIHLADFVIFNNADSEKLEIEVQKFLKNISQ